MPVRHPRRLLAVALAAAAALCTCAGAAAAKPAAAPAPRIDTMIRKSAPIPVLARAHWIRSGSTSPTITPPKR